MCLMAAFNASVSTSISVSETIEQDSPFDAHPQNTEDTTTTTTTAAASEGNATKSTFLIEHVSYTV